MAQMQGNVASGPHSLTSDHHAELVSTPIGGKAQTFLCVSVALNVRFGVK